ncbi:MAG TPA: HlyD family secretion protein [Acetobacteraceae bacterium]|nr:HlyD family secretion protein [Acetobacteraceae bacterium]
MRIRRVVLTLALLIVIGGGLYYFWISGAGTVTTDDAYTEGHPVAMAPQVAGTVVALNAGDNQFVHKGDLLVEIDPRTYVAARDQAEAGLALAQSQLASAEQDLAVARTSYPAQLAEAKAAQEQAAADLAQAEQNERRQLGLPRGATSQQNRDDAVDAANAARAKLDQTKAAVAAADDVESQIAAAEALVGERKAAVAQAGAALERAKVDLSYTRVTAPSDGWITDRGITLGTYVQPGTTMFSIVKPEPWIIANFKETQLDHIRPGQRVSIHVDAYPGLDLVGRVDSIQQGSGSVFSAFPAENATGNFVKIVQRVPVKIVITNGLDAEDPLPLGLSVEPVVHLR